MSRLEWRLSAMRLVRWSGQQSALLLTVLLSGLKSERQSVLPSTVPPSAMTLGYLSVLLLELPSMALPLGSPLTVLLLGLRSMVPPSGLPSAMLMSVGQLASPTPTPGGPLPRKAERTDVPSQAQRPSGRCWRVASPGSPHAYFLHSTHNFTRISVLSC